MTLAAKLVWAFLRDLVRDLGVHWLRSMVLRLVLATLALVAMVAAIGVLLGQAHAVLSAAIGPLYASLAVAAFLGVAAAGLYLANRLVRRRAIRRQEDAKALALSTVSLIRAAAGKDALPIMTVALLAGFMVGNRAGGSPPDDRSAAAS